MMRLLRQSSRRSVISTLLLIAVASLTVKASPVPILFSPDAGGSGAASGAARPTFVVAPSVQIAGQPTAVTATDLNGDGFKDLIVANSKTGTVDVLLGNGRGGFKTPVHYKVGTDPRGIVASDFNNDGKVDIAVVNRGSDTLSVLLGKGDGTLQAAVAYRVGHSPSAVVAFALTSRGTTDLAVTNGDGNNISVLVNRGDGSFQAAVPYSVASPRAIVAGDFDNDGTVDLVVGSADGSVTIFSGSGDGALRASHLVRTGAAALSAMATADFDHDGKLDLAVADSASNAVSVMLGTGDGHFQTALSNDVGNEPASLAVEDANGDGNPDLIAVNRAGNTVSVLLGKGDGALEAAADFVVGKAPTSLAMADFNGDGHLDLATANTSDGTLSIPLGNGDGTFRAARDYRAQLERKSVAVGDLNGDSRSDLVVANYCGAEPKCTSHGTASVFLNMGNGTLRLAYSLPLGKGPVGIALADVNGDKKLDLIAANRDESSLMVFLGNGDSTFQQPMSYSISGSPVAVIAADFNRDGKTDLAVTTQCASTRCTQPGVLNILLGNGDGSFKVGVSLPVGFSPFSMASGDLHGDGNLDLVVVNACGSNAACSGGTASVLIGDGKGGFQLSPEIALGRAPSAVALSDLNRDGKPDLIVSNSGDSALAVMAGIGNGTFGKSMGYGVGANPSALAVADFDGDGKLDVVVSSFKNSTVDVLVGNGDGTLQTAASYAVGAGPEALAALVLTENGRPSLVTANGNSGGTPAGNDITVLGNAVDGTTTIVTINPSSVSVEVDQTQSFIVTVTPSQAVTWSLTGTCATGCGTLSNQTATSVDYTAPATIPTGTVILTAIAADSTTGDAPITVTDYSVDFAPTSRTVTQGNNATTTVTITAINGYIGAVDITCTGLPAGTTCNPLRITSPATTGALTVVTTGATPSGLHNITVKGTDNATAPVSHNAPQPFAVTVKTGVTVNPATPLVEVNNTQQFTATVTDTNKNVTWALSLSGVPCSPTCGTLSATPPNQVTYTAPAAVPAGTVTLTATSVADATASGTATITVTDYSVDFAPPSRIVTQGNNATTTVTITAINGYTGAVDITCTGLPAGTTCNPLRITSPATTGTLTAVTTATTPLGTHNITVNGTDNATAPVSHNTPQPFAVTVRCTYAIALMGSGFELPGNVIFADSTTTPGENFQFAVSRTGGLQCQWTAKITDNATSANATWTTPNNTTSTNEQTVPFAVADNLGAAAVTRSATIQVSDAGGGSASAPPTITQQVISVAPVAPISAMVNVVIGPNVSFATIVNNAYNKAASWAVDQTIVNCYQVFPAPCGQVASTGVATALYTPPARLADGNTQAKSTITATSLADASKLNATQVGGVVIENQPPICGIPAIEAGVPSNGTAPAIRITANPCQDNENDILTTNGYTIDWGDPKPTDTVSDPTQIAHVYAQGSTSFPLTLTATDTSIVQSTPVSTVVYLTPLLGQGAPSIVSGASASNALQLTTPTAGQAGDDLTFTCTAINVVPTNVPSSLTSICAFSPNPAKFSSGAWPPVSMTICAVGKNSAGQDPGACGAGMLLKQTAGNQGSIRRLSLGWLFLPATVLFGIMLGSGRSRTAAEPRPAKRRLIALVILVALAVLLPACGGGFSGTVQPPGGAPGGMPVGSYALTVQAMGTVSGVPVINHYVVSFQVTPSN